MTNWDYYEAVQRFQRVLDAQGISAHLKALGATEGDSITIGGYDFDYVDRKTRWMGDMGLEDVQPRRHDE